MNYDKLLTKEGQISIGAGHHQQDDIRNATSR